MDEPWRQLRIRTREEIAGIWGVGEDPTEILSSEVVCLVSEGMESVLFFGFLFLLFVYLFIYLFIFNASMLLLTA